MKSENRNRDKKSKRLLCTALAAIIVLSVCAGVLPVGADAVTTRSVEHDSVAPGAVVNVTIEFTTTWDFWVFWIQDHVPLGWDVTDMRVNEDANETLKATEFNATKGKVMFLWYPISSGVDVKAEYKLHVPTDAEPGEYDLTGDLCGITEINSSWSSPIPAGTVVVKSEYDVNLSVDEEEKTTDSNVNATYYIIVENTGTESDTYALSITATEADAWLNKTSVSLDGGESEVVELNVSSFLADDYSTTVEASSAHASDEITVTTTVAAFYEVDLEVTPEEQTVALSTNATYLLTVKNVGTIDDTYTLEVEKPVDLDVAELSTYTINLAHGATVDVLLNVSDGTEDEYVVNVTVTGTGVSDEVMTKTIVGYALGDVDCDGNIWPNDAVLIMQYYVGIIDELPCAVCADVDCDGNIWPNDAVLIMQYYVGIIDEFPC